MKSIKAVAALLLAAMLTVMLAGCFTITVNGKSIFGNGEMATRDFELANTVTGINNESSIDVIIDPSLTGKAVLEGESNLIELVEVTQGANGLVMVDMRPGISIMLNRSMTLRIPAMEGGLVEINGSGNVTLESGTLTGDAFDVRIAGSGDIRIALETKALTLSIDGSGDMDLSAKADTLTANSNGSGEIVVSGEGSRIDVRLNGSGDFRGLGFAVQDAQVNISGSGNADVNVTGEITGSINGSGNINYAGNPGSVSISENGSGDARPR